MTTRVNVLLSTFDGERFLAEQLGTILGQTDVELRLTARDDGSRDGTRSILDAAAASDPRVTVQAGPNLGAARSFFELLRLADGSCQYFAFADQDDLWPPDKLSSAVRLLDTVPAGEPALYCAALEFIDERGRPRGRTSAPRLIAFENALVENIAIGCTVVINTAARELLLRYTPERPVMHDAWAYLALSAFGHVFFDPQPRVGYRQHGGNAFGADPRRFAHFLLHLRRVLRSRGLGFHAQAVSFQRCFGEQLDPRRAAILRRFVDSQASLGARLAYALRKDVVRQSAWHDFLVRILIATGAC